MPHTSIYVSSYLHMCVLIPLYMCPHTSMCRHTSICVFIPLYMVSSYRHVSSYLCVFIPYVYTCPHTSIYVSSYLYMCPHTSICVSSFLYICVLIPLYMCPHTTTPVHTRQSPSNWVLDVGKRPSVSHKSPALVHSNDRFSYLYVCVFIPL